MIPSASGRPRPALNILTGLVAHTAACLSVLLPPPASAAEADTALPSLTNVHCVVILQTRPDRLYCYSTNLPFRVILNEGAKFAHGEEFLASGSLMADGFVEAVPTLLANTIVRLGRTNVPPPLRLRPAELVERNLNFHRVALVGRVTAHEWMKFLNRHIEVVIAEDRGQTFRVNFLNYSDVRRHLPIGSEVEFTGLSFLETFLETVGPEVQMDMENLDDCRVVNPAPWLTLEVARRLVGVAAGFLAMGGLWLVRERRQIARLREAERAVRQLNNELEVRIADRTVELRDANGRLRQEVAAREQAEAGLRVALAEEREVGALKSRFVSTVSHEFRTPLAVILSSAEILEAYPGRLTDEERGTHLRDITGAARRMGRMVDEVLLLSRYEAGKMSCRPAALDLAAFCAQVAEDVLSATQRRCPIRCQTPAQLPPAWADESLLRHIFVNLLTNAVKYSEPGRAVEFRVDVDADHAHFVVRDHGLGIPEADQRQLFTAFHRGSNVGTTPGSGLGLVIVKACVELHGGSIRAESREGEGTVMSVSLPLFVRPPDTSEA